MIELERVSYLNKHALLVNEIAMNERRESRRKSIGACLKHLGMTANKLKWNRFRNFINEITDLDLSHEEYPSKEHHNRPSDSPSRRTMSISNLTAVQKRTAFKKREIRSIRPEIPY